MRKRSHKANPDWNRLDRYGQTALMNSVQCHSLASTKALLRFGASPVAAAHGCLTALHSAAFFGATGCLKELLRTRLPIDRDGCTPLHYAARQTHIGVLRLLLKAGANPSLADNKGVTSLHWAAEKEDPTVLSLLLRAGASLEADGTYDGFKHPKTPLHRACWSGNLKNVRILLDAGANPDRIEIEKPQHLFHVFIPNDIKHLIEELLAREQERKLLHQIGNAEIARDARRM